ncbi:MAG: hypothetical protein M3Z23_14135 [Acidobacteriota bacterium]|nr:hypothetical protein [Acidobacteriota bacterium]
MRGLQGVVRDGVSGGRDSRFAVDGERGRLGRGRRNGFPRGLPDTVALAAAGLSIVKNLTGSGGAACTGTFAGGILSASTCP